MTRQGQNSSKIALSSLLLAAACWLAATTVLLRSINKKIDTKRHPKRISKLLRDHRPNNVFIYLLSILGIQSICFESTALLIALSSLLVSPDDLLLLF